jgi:hypothetical protein
MRRSSSLRETEEIVEEETKEEPSEDKSRFKQL